MSVGDCLEDMFKFTTHHVVNEEGIKFDTASDVFSELKGKGFYKTVGFKDIAMIYGDTEKSFRKTSDLINRMRFQEEKGTPSRTLQDNTEKEGIALIEHTEQKVKGILEVHGFSEDTQCREDNGFREAVSLPQEMVIEAAKQCIPDDMYNEVLDNPVCYEDPEHTTNISVDDVIVKKQEETREQQGKSEEGKRKYVHNTVAHVSQKDRSYTLNGFGMKQVLLFPIAFIFNNGLAKDRFQFFTDGHKTLNDTILKCFKWYSNMGIMLDWYHLVKKCKEQLSMAMKGRVVRNEFLSRLLPLLWNGLTDRAIALIEQMDPNQIKNPSVIEKLITYLNRNKSYIPCYAVRKHLGLRNSSNIGEKMNDLLVSERQKHNGMSWSKSGSVALASITALKRNRESKNWFEKGEINFKLVANYG